MKTFASILVLVVLSAGLWWWGEKNNMGEVAQEPREAEAEELCFAKFTDSADSEFEDKYTLRLEFPDVDISEDGARGELRLLPAEKDALVGKFTGSVSLEGKDTWNGLGDFIWQTEGEGMTAKQELKVIFEGQGYSSAKIGFGEMALNEESGVYEYADPAKVDYSFELRAVDCGELDEREAVEKYLWENIAKLSPIAPVLGGNWYVVSAKLDLAANNGTVVYEDGHVQEKRDFTYVLDADGAVESMSIE